MPSSVPNDYAISLAVLVMMDGDSMDEDRRKSKDFIVESAASLVKVLLNSPGTEIVLDTIVDDIVVTTVTEDGGKMCMVVRGGRWRWEEGGGGGGGENREAVVRVRDGGEA